ncbi:MAG: elongation factor P maturation arginine rhamnosyltransferase EarP [Spongiibacteraceae bacterium]
MLTKNSSPRWDIFCTVVDNFGDIGVCWRLARQLAKEHKLTVRLWVDDLIAFQQLCPAVTLQAQQQQQHVEIRHWQASTDFSSITAADAVIEGFACTIPPQYLAAMAARPIAPIWFNLEYLTAETWAGEYHGLPSIEPNSGLYKYFFLPGFEAKTGGLLREASLLAQRDSLQQDLAARSEFLTSLGLDPAADALLISLFSYENTALPELLDAMSTGEQTLHLVIPQGRVTTVVETYLGEALIPGRPIVRGALCLQAVTFMTQINYDRLLWCCDLNIVRGEDSLVRAIWSGRPLLWHCYPQQNDEHLIKVKALLNLYLPSIPPALSQIVATLWLGWNQSDNENKKASKKQIDKIHSELNNNSVGTIWSAYITNINTLSTHAKAWSSILTKQPDLATQLLLFYKKLL